MPNSDARKQAEKLLQIDLPKTASSVWFYPWRPSKDLKFFQAHLKFDSTEEEFTFFAAKLGLHPAGAPDAMHLPASWGAPPGVELEWWDPSPETPSNARARSYGVNGWIVAKLERRFAFLILTDTDHPAGTPGPF